MTIPKVIHSKGGSKKYVLEKTFKCYIPFTPSADIHSSYCMLDRSGWIIISEGYEWDGASGPTLDTEDTMAGALVHDVLYQFIREGRLDYSARKAADKCIYQMCVDAGMPKWRANYWYFFLRLFGGNSAK